MILLTLVLCALAQPTPDRFATVQLVTSPAAGSTVDPNQTIQWRIEIVVDTGSRGLSGFSVDLVQSESNPSPFDLTPAVLPSTGSVIADFSRPRGISNPEIGNLAASGFGGTTIGTPGSRNLTQIGGMQNTFGVPGTLIGTDTVVQTGIGQAVVPQVLAEGTFVIPDGTGQYCLELRNLLANGLVSDGPVNGLWTVEQLLINSDSVVASCLNVSAMTCDSVDFNRNGVFPENADILDFFDVLAGGPCPYVPSVGEGCDIDFNNNGVFPEDVDILEFFDVLAGGTCP